MHVAQVEKTYCHARITCKKRATKSDTSGQCLGFTITLKALNNHNCSRTTSPGQVTPQEHPQHVNASGGNVRFKPESLLFTPCTRWLGKKGHLFSSLLAKRSNFFQAENFRHLSESHKGPQSQASNSFFNWTCSPGSNFESFKIKVAHQAQDGDLQQPNYCFFLERHCIMIPQECWIRLWFLLCCQKRVPLVIMWPQRSFPLGTYEIKTGIVLVCWELTWHCIDFLVLSNFQSALWLQSVFSKLICLEWIFKGEKAGWKTNDRFHIILLFKQFPAAACLIQTNQGAYILS